MAFEAALWLSISPPGLLASLGLAAERGSSALDPSQNWRGCDCVDSPYFNVVLKEMVSSVATKIAIPWEERVGLATPLQGLCLACGSGSSCVKWLIPSSTFLSAAPAVVFVCRIGKRGKFFPLLFRVVTLNTFLPPLPYWHHPFSLLQHPDSMTSSA